VAVLAQGVTVTWGGQPLAEVRGVSVEGERGLPLARASTWTLELGTIRVQTFDDRRVPRADQGRRRRLVVTAPGDRGTTLTVFDGDCIFRDRVVALEVNDAVRFDFVFQIMDTTNAPS
jgi:hypothetical protein